MGEVVMSCPIEATMDMARGLLNLKLMPILRHSIVTTVIIDITPLAIDLGLPMAMARGLQMQGFLEMWEALSQKLSLITTAITNITRGLPSQKLFTITMDITRRRALVFRRAMVLLMVATTKGLLKRNLSIITDMGTISRGAMATRGEVSCQEKIWARSTITNEAQMIPAPELWSV